MTSSSPVLILELVGPILSHAIRLVRPRRLDQNQPLVAIIKVLPRSYMPTVSDTAIMVMPWVDTEFACNIGNLWLLDTLHDRLARAPMCRPLVFTADRALRKAAVAGVHVLEWWVTHFGGLHDDYDSAILLASCKSGNLVVLKWWMSMSREIKMGASGRAIEMATKHGHLDILEYLRKNGFPFSYVFSCDSQDVVLNQQLSVVKWWIEHDLLAKFPKQMLQYAMVAAAVQGDRQTLDTLLAMLDIQARFKDSEIAKIASFACATGDLEFIKHCHRTCPEGLSDPISYLVASARAHVHVLDWLVKHNVPHGHVKLSDPDCRLLDKRTLKLGLPMMRRLALEFSPFFFAIASGHIPVLDWLQAHGFTPNLQADKLAIQFASVLTLDWIRTHQPDLLALADVDACLHYASQSGSIGVLKWRARHEDLERKLTKPISLREAPIAAWEWWSESGLPFCFHEPGDRARRYDSPPSLDVCEWLLQHGRLPMWKLPEWVIKVGYADDGDRFLTWLEANGLIQSLFETEELHWPLHTSDSFLLTWPSLLWWIENGGPKFKARLQHIPLSFINVLKLDFIWRQCGKGKSVSLDGDRLSFRNGHLALEWGLQTGLVIEHRHAFKSATRGAQEELSLATLEWWRKNLVRMQPAIPKARSVAKLCRGNDDVWEWWERSGLLADVADVIQDIDDIFMNDYPSDDSDIGGEQSELDE